MPDRPRPAPVPRFHHPPNGSTVRKAIGWGFGLTLGYLLAVLIIPTVLFVICIFGCAGCFGLAAVLSSGDTGEPSREAQPPQPKTTDSTPNAFSNFCDGVVQAFEEAKRRGEEAERQQRESEERHWQEALERQWEEMEKPRFEEAEAKRRAEQQKPFPPELLHFEPKTRPIAPEQPRQKPKWRLYR